MMRLAASKRSTVPMVVVNKGDKNDQKKRDYTLYYTGGAFGLLVGNGTTTAAVTSPGITSVQWYTIVAWHDSVNDTLNIQVNNGDVRTVSYSGGAMDTSFPLVIGAHSDGTFGLNGLIDEVALYKRVLNAGEREWLYHAGSGRTYADLTAPSVPVIHTTSMTYDAAGRKTSMTDPDMGYWTYDYDALGNLKTQTDARGCTTNLLYDALSRLTKKSYSNCPSTPTVSYYYDGQAFTFNGTTYNAFTNPFGRRTGMIVSGSSAARWDYDKRGRMTRQTQNIVSGGVFTTEWNYNTADLPTAMTYPGDGETVAFDYNSRMLLEKLRDTKNSPDNTVDDSFYVSSTTYDLAGRINSRTLGNQVVQNYKYFPWNSQGGRLEKMAAGTDTWDDVSFSFANNLQNLTYAYDPGGNIVQITNNLTTVDEKQIYKYDKLDRLRCWGLTTQTGTSQCDTYVPASDSFSGVLSGGDEEYRYDPATGNLDIKAGVDLNYNDTAHKHAVTHIGTDQRYWYDANGNQIKRIVGPDTYDLVYDAENRLSQVKKNNTVIATFTYDGDGNRVKSVIGSETTVFIGGYYEVTNPGSGQTVTKYYFAGAQRVAMRKTVVPQSETLTYLFGDHLGSTSLAVDASDAETIMFHLPETKTTQALIHCLESRRGQRSTPS